MSDHSVGTTSQRQLDSRANLLYLLRTLAERDQARANELKMCIESSSRGEQIEACIKPERAYLVATAFPSRRIEGRAARPSTVAVASAPA